MEKEWYVVNTYSGHESKVKEKLEMRAESMGMQDYIFRVIVPETTEVEIKDGGYPSSFTLYPGDSINVTWDDQGDGFRGGYTYYSYKDAGKNLGSVYAKYYNSIKTVLFTYD